MTLLWDSVGSVFEESQLRLLAFSSVVFRPKYWRFQAPHEDGVRKTRFSWSLWANWESLPTAHGLLS